jgi:hypothetical protein
VRLRRLVLATLLAAALSPGLWWRNEPQWPEGNGLQSLTMTPLKAHAPRSWPAALRLVGAWHLTSRNNHFGGYSALLATDGETLTAISDSATWLRFGRPGSGAPAAPRLGRVGLATEYWDAWVDSDIEAATLDPRTGSRWYAFEKSNRIMRFAPDGKSAQEIRPPAMRDWHENGGPEAMVRLADGRFIVLAEDPPWLSDGGSAGLLFPTDPVTGARPLEFTFRPPLGYHPSDMAALPDGRVMILLRALDPPFPPFFKGMLLVADPAGIAAGREWPWRKLADLAEPLPLDNYEGLAAVPDADGVTLWLISDDNFAHFQRTLLLELHWQIPPRKTGAN